jgi:hypothetical protein
MWHFAQHSYMSLLAVTMATWPFTPIHMFHTVVQYSGVKGSIRRQIQTPVQGNSSISETVWNRTQVHIHFFCLEWPILWTQNIDISSWDTLCACDCVCV